MIIGTTNDPHLLSDLVIREAFNVSVRVPEVKGAEALKNGKNLPQCPSLISCSLQA